MKQNNFLQAKLLKRLLAIHLSTWILFVLLLNRNVFCQTSEQTVLINEIQLSSASRKTPSTVRKHAHRQEFLELRVYGDEPNFSLKGHVIIQVQASDVVPKKGRIEAKGPYISFVSVFELYALPTIVQNGPLKNAF